MAQSCGTVVVEPAFSQSDVTASCNVQTSTITEGEKATVVFDVTNNNDVAANVEFGVSVDGSLLDATSTLTVDANSSGSTEYTISGLSQGSHDINAEIISASQA